MKYCLFILMCCLSILSMAQSHIEGEIIIAFYDENMDTRDNNKFGILGQDIILKETLSEEMGIYLFENQSVYADEVLIGKLKQQTEIREAQLNYKANYRGVPNDALFEQQWNLDKISASEAWELTTGGTTAQGDTIVVFVIDEGIDVNHEDLKSNLWYNKAEIPNDGIDNDNNGFVDDYRGWNETTGNDQHIPSFHGTPVAGVIGAKGNNGVGMSGVNWNVKIMMYGLAPNIMTAANIIKGYDYALQQRKRYNESNGTEGAYVVATNLSAGFEGLFPEDTPLLCETYNRLGAEGILSVSSVDNRSAINVQLNGDIPTTCSSPYLIAVTDTNEKDERRGAYGDRAVDIAAPGTGCYSVQPLNQYGVFGGTSCAAPHVAGTIGLMYAMALEPFMQEAKENPSNTALALKEIILGGVDKLPELENEIVSEGRLNLYRTLNLMERYFTVDLELLTLTRFYPNPAYNELNLELVENGIEDYTIQIYNTIGQLMYEKSINADELSLKIVKIDLTTFQSGIYFLSLYNSTGQNIQTILTKPFIKH